MVKRIEAIKDRKQQGDNTSKSHPVTIFDDILDSNLPDQEKSTERLWREARIFLAAGTETTAWMLAVITYYLLENPRVMRKLREALEQVIRGSSVLPGMTTLEQIPYLVSVAEYRTPKLLTFARLL